MSYKNIRWIFAYTLAFFMGLTAFQARAQSPEPEKNKRPSFEELDANKDGKVSLDEMKKHHETKMTEHFKKTDQNGDGYLSKEEHDSPMRPQMASFESLDSNGDGNVSKAEFDAAMEKRKKEMKEPVGQ
jgi:Ca2+-binding EF-hand superfamily protein